MDTGNLSLLRAPLTALQCCQLGCGGTVYDNEDIQNDEYHCGGLYGGHYGVQFQI